jgi:recombinational DNA repair protein (RecF pathway)
VAGPAHTFDAWVLNRRPPAESFQTLIIFSTAQGAQTALQRVSKKAAGNAVLDLFDEAALVVEEPNSGQAVFVKETRILTRHPELGKSYATLQKASALAQLIARNPVAEESRAAIYDLLRDAFRAFAENARADVVYLKSLYRFCRDEGYPLKQAWVPALPNSDRAELMTLLNQPVSAQSTDAKVVARLQRNLDDYLRSETEIQLEG